MPLIRILSALSSPFKALTEKVKYILPGFRIVSKLIITTPQGDKTLLLMTLLLMLSILKPETVFISIG